MERVDSDETALQPSFHSRSSYGSCMQRRLFEGEPTIRRSRRSLLEQRACHAEVFYRFLRAEHRAPREEAHGSACSRLVSSHPRGQIIKRFGDEGRQQQS